MPAPPRERGAGRRVAGILLALVVVAAAVVLGFQLFQQFRSGDDGTPEASASATATAPSAIPLAATSTAYDPVYDPADEALDSGDGEENDALAGDATDGDPATLWTTSNYFDPLEAQKPGVGLLLDLDAVHTVSSVDLSLLTAGGTVELRVAPEDATEAPATPDEFTVVATAEDPAIDVTMAPETAVRTRFVLVWFTVLPQYEGNYKNGVAEAVVLGE